MIPSLHLFAHPFIPCRTNLFHSILGRSYKHADLFLEQMGKPSGHVIRLIFRIMCLYRNNHRIQIECCAVLANMAAVDRNREAILSEGCLQQIILNMDRYTDRPEVLTEICAALANLALFGISQTADGWIP